MMSCPAAGILELTKQQNRSSYQISISGAVRTYGRAGGSELFGARLYLPARIPGAFADLFPRDNCRLGEEDVSPFASTPFPSWITRLRIRFLLYSQKKIIKGRRKPLLVLDLLIIASSCQGQQFKTKGVHRYSLSRSVGKMSCEQGDRMIAVLPSFMGKLLHISIRKRNRNAC